MQFGTLYMSMTERGLGDFPGIVQAHVSRFARFFQLASCCSRVA